MPLRDALTTPDFGEHALQREYARRAEAQTVVWQGSTISLAALEDASEQTERRARERAWRLAAERALADREPIGDLWKRFVPARHRQAANAGFPDYRAFRWQQLGRTDYTPDDCLRFHHTIEEWVTPVAVRLDEERRVRLGLRRFQPWDLREGITEVHRIVLRLLLGVMVDAFEHWTYSHVEEAADLSACGRRWRGCWLRFLPSVDWSGLDDELEADWQGQARLFLSPLTSMELALEQLGAIRSRTAGAHNTFDEHTIRETMESIEDAL